LAGNHHPSGLAFELRRAFAHRSRLFRMRQTPHRKPRWRSLSKKDFARLSILVVYLLVCSAVVAWLITNYHE